jgi:hypothetical protein
MNFKRKVISASFALLGLMSIGAYLFDSPGGPPNNYSGLGYMMVMMVGIGLEVFVLLLAGLILYFRKVEGEDELIRAGKVPEHKQQGNALFLAIGLVLLVGVSLCFGGAEFVYG